MLARQSLVLPQGLSGGAEPHPYHKPQESVFEFHRMGAQKPRRCFLAGKQPVQLLRKKKSLLSETALDFWDFVLDHFNLPPDGED